MEGSKKSLEFKDLGTLPPKFNPEKNATKFMAYYEKYLVQSNPQMPPPVWLPENWLYQKTALIGSYFTPKKLFGLLKYLNNLWFSY